MTMAELQEQEPTPPKVGTRKGVSIHIMFPCESDEEAIHIKARIDEIIKDIPEKRYTFGISEV